jgi:hypothetical protein
MTEITLADYVGHIFLEIVKAREMADSYSRRVAEAYAKDPVMKFFSVPRFKAAHMDLTIPILISGARISQAIRFRPTAEEFSTFVQSQIENFTKAVFISREDWKDVAVLESARRASVTARKSARATRSNAIVTEFYAQLMGNADPAHPENIVTLYWREVVMLSLKENDLFDLYEKHNPKDELLRKTTDRISDWVTSNTVVERTTIDNLLINPETNVVKNGSNDTSVFTISAKMLEEGFYIHSIKDENTGGERPIVEFD